MKKIIVLCLAIAMVACMGITVFASTGAFVDSPSLNPSPELKDGECECGCQSKLTATAYGERDQLSESARKLMEAAYTAIRGTQDLTTLNPDIAKFAKKCNVGTDTLAVSDLFDITAAFGEGHKENSHFEVALESDMLKNFVCLLHYYGGEWHIVEDAKVSEDGKVLEFDESQFSPFAVVVSSEEVVPDDGGVAIIIIAILLVIAAGVAVFFVLKYKGKKDEPVAQAEAAVAEEAVDAETQEEAPAQEENTAEENVEPEAQEENAAQTETENK